MCSYGPDAGAGAGDAAVALMIARQKVPSCSGLRMGEAPLAACISDKSTDELHADLGVDAAFESECIVEEDAAGGGKAIL